MDRSWIPAAALAACVAAAGCSEGGPVAPGPTAVVEAGEQHKAPSQPQQITIVQGEVVVDFDPSGWVSLRGTRGFTIEGRLGDGVYPGRQCRDQACEPGDPIIVGGFWVAPDIRGGEVTLQGERFSVAGPNDPGLSLELHAEITAPPQAEQATLTTPVTIKGTFQDPSLSQHTFEGHGTATVSLEWNVHHWAVTGVRYEFGGRARGGRQT